METIRQFSLRTLIALPLLAGTGLILFDRLWVYDRSTSGTELVDITVVDPEGAAVAGAVLRSSDAKMEPKPKTTNADGVVAFAHSYRYERFTSLLRDRYSHLSAHTITISSPGFKTATIEVEVLSPRQRPQLQFAVSNCGPACSCDNNRKVTKLPLGWGWPFG